LRKVTLMGGAALGGLLCTLLAPQANAQLVLRKATATVTVNESSLNFSDTLLLPQFQKLVTNPNAQLYGVDIEQITTASLFGSVTNNGAASKTFNLEAGLLTSSTTPDGTALNTQDLYTKNNLRLASGGSFSFNATETNFNYSGLTSSNLGAYNGTGTVGIGVSGQGFSGVTGDPSGLTLSTGTNGVGVTDKITYWYYTPFSPVPELGTSISLGLMGLVGGALGLRARRRAR
jgi:hypothetical protein